MKHYLRILAASSLLVFGLSAQTATDTTSTAAKKHAKTKSTAFTPTANASASDIAAAKASGKVWVNTSSKAYHKSTSKYFGATKAGKFMSEADAQKAGYHLAKD
jgi:hypothetical protein